jgi:SAM-dependent methyltransferase
VSEGVRSAYVESAHAWHGAPERVYAALANAVVEASPAPLQGARVLDVGAGTGVGVRAAHAAGCGHAVGLDLADTMLRVGGLTSCAVVGDVDRIPFADNAFDLAIASCVLSHVPRPDRTLAELLRVSAAAAASAFRDGWTHPAKSVVDSVVGQHGFVAPRWYSDLKDTGERRVSSAERLVALGQAAGWAHCDVQALEVRTGLTMPEELVQWRLGLAHIAPWLASLSDEDRGEVESTAVARLGDVPELVVPLLVLRCVRDQAIADLRRLR